MRVNSKQAKGLRPARRNRATAVIEVGEVEIDPVCFEIRRGAARLAIEPRVFDFLLYLARNRDRVVTKDELIDAVWGGSAVSEGALARCASVARKVLGSRAFIVTVHRRGYRWAGSAAR